MWLDLDTFLVDTHAAYPLVSFLTLLLHNFINTHRQNQITPSYVAFTNSGERLVGDAAKNQATINPANTIFDVKRLIGREYTDKSVVSTQLRVHFDLEIPFPSFVLTVFCPQQADKKLVPYKIISINNRPMVEINTNGIATTFAPEELSAMILQKMKATAEAYLGEEVETAVITVPAYSTTTNARLLE